MSESPEITFVICTYNNAAVLDRTLQSLADQKVRSGVIWSVLVVDNNSTDETSPVVNRHLERQTIPGLRRVLETHQGTAFARRRGIEETTSPFIAFVDDDNFLAPDWVQHAIDFCAAHDDADIVCGRIQLMWEAPPSELALQHRAGFVFQDYGDQVIRWPAPGCRLPPTAGLILRRSAVMRSGWMDRLVITGARGNTLMRGEDTELVIRMYRTGSQIWYDPNLRLDHFILERRTSFEYLCRLYRAFARSSAMLEALSFDKPPSLGWRLSLLARRLPYLVRRTAAWGYHDVLMHRRWRTRRLIQVHEALGQVESAWGLLWTKLAPA